MNPTNLFLDYGRLGLGILKNKVIQLSDRIHTSDFKNTIRGSVHHSQMVERMNAKGQYIIWKLFEAYYTNPQQLPDGPIMHFLVDLKPKEYPNIDVVRTSGIGLARMELEQIRAKNNVYTECLLMRRICDHIASMTDHYAIEEYTHLYG